MRHLGFAILFGAILALSTSCTKKHDPNDNTIYHAIKANVKGLDPVHSDDQYSSTVISQIYEGLLGYHYLKRPLELVPVLADGMPEVSKDGLTHTFKIKKGIMFQDDGAFPTKKGREVTAEDFVYSWKRLADPRNRSPGFWVIDGKIKGLNEWATAVTKEKANYDTPVAGLQAPEKHKLVITLTEPYSQLHSVIAMPFLSVVPKEAVDKYGPEFINHPVGTGPFQLTNWIRNSKITLEKSKTWRGETYPSEGEASDKDAGLLADAGKPIPFVDKVVIEEITEDQPRWLNFQKGNLDNINIPKDNFEQAVKDGKLVETMAQRGDYLSVSKDPDVVYVSFNMRDPLLGKNKKLRQAMSLAYDNATHIDKFYNGRAIVAQGPIPPDVDGYDESFKNPYIGFNLDKAKALLKESGHDGGKGIPELTYDTLSDTTSRQSAEFFQQMMGKLGIKIKIRTNTWPQFQEKIKKMQSQIHGIAWSADYPDGQNFLQLFYSKNISPGPNGSNYESKEFDKVYEQALLLQPGPERTALYKKAVAIAVEDAPWIFNAHRLEYRVNHKWVKNFKRNAILHEGYRYWKIDPKERAEIKAKL